MGLVFDQVSFDGRAPDLALIAAKVTELNGLRVIVEQADAEVKGPLCDQHGHIAFACAPQEKLELCTYQPGAVRKFHDEFTDGVELPIEKFVQGLNEPAGTQVIYLRSIFGVETLTGMTLLALESLGGRLREPISDELRREYGRPITEAELQQRRRQVQRQMWKAGLLALLLLPVTVPLFILGLFVHLARLPEQIRKGQEIAREAIGKRDHQKLLSVLPDQVEFVTTDPANHKMLDREALRHYAEALEALGFVHAVDYSVRYPGHATLGKNPPGFARVWVHPAHRCIAEVNQVWGKEEHTPVRCLVASCLENDWELMTTDRKPMPLFYAWRRPRYLWSRHPRMSPVELLAEHLQRRRQMMNALGIAVTTELTAEAYFALLRKRNFDNKEALRAKSIEKIRAEMRECERFYEWSGDLPPHCWGHMDSV